MPLKAILFDLDNTLYPPATGLLERADERINDYIGRRFALALEEVAALRRRFIAEFGTTLNGLRQDPSFDTERFLAHVHDEIAVEEHLSVDEELLVALAAIEVEKIIFTNAPRAWAARTLRALGLAEHFRTVIDLEFLEYHGKPAARAYQRVLDHIGREATECAMVEDTLRNLEVAKQLGMTCIWVGEGTNAPAYVDYTIARAADVPGVLARLADAAAAG